MGLDYRETKAFSQGGFRGEGDPFPLFMFQSSGRSRRVLRDPGSSPLYADCCFNFRKKNLSVISALIMYEK